MDEIVIPSFIQIETVAGLCNYRCIMCPITESRVTGVMSNEVWTKILNRLLPHVKHIDYLSLCGLGEPMLDKKVHEKVRIAKDLGFRGTGIFTNGELVPETMSEKLMDARLDTLIVSIDGVKKETQSTIRLRSNLDKIVDCMDRFIFVRDRRKRQGKSTTRLMIKFVRQSLNESEEQEYYEFWSRKLKSEYNDKVAFYNVNNVGGRAYFPEKLSDEILAESKNFRCDEVYRRAFIAEDGRLNFCAGDQDGSHNMGNIFTHDLVEAYNSEMHRRYRATMDRGEILSLELCKNCSIARTISTKVIKDPMPNPGESSGLVQIQLR
ncbi:MAG: hypothetical protein A2831_02280 [Candidatus Yanofskybacteria bacterium RIFCSPHIGHO2_01_FULL_44_17]|uniref:Radical SAM core domain-containing protein n=1 Tax=Candidatus Yanofskybacteria bacterium RIFCSPHIGHO2_01_FULL_44_17 TaxID=1802668 RepID=A0A1F8ETC0_9BACT|nr:MAG: hypothetical protein A2831_02280 [Candidatus Yanofskybacteria bacterium RIFCSPHIGHO2_01_FULL_44_17]